MKPLALLATLITGALLLYGTADFAAWGDPQSPPHSNISVRYVEQAVKETHVPNIVTAVLGGMHYFADPNGGAPQALGRELPGMILG